MPKVRVPIVGSPLGSALIDPRATEGAVLGANLVDSDGNVVTLDRIAAAIATLIAPSSTSDNVAAALSAAIKQHIADLNNPHDTTKAQVGLGSVTNDAQTKAAVVPNTAPSAGQILVGNAGGTAYAPVSMSGHATMTSAGVVTVSVTGAVTLIGTSTVSGSAVTTLATPALNLDADGVYFIEFSFKNATASNADIRLFYNADTTVTNYDTQICAVAAAALAAARGNTATIFSLLASSCSVGTINMAKDPDGKPTVNVDNKEGTSSTLRRAFSCQFWRTAGTNVTLATFSSSVANAIGVGSWVKVWKVT